MMGISVSKNSSRGVVPQKPLDGLSHSVKSECGTFSKLNASVLGPSVHWKDTK